MTRKTRAKARSPADKESARLRTLSDASIRITDEEAALMLAYHLTLAALLMAQFSQVMSARVAHIVGQMMDGDRLCPEAQAAGIFVKYLDAYYERLEKEERT